MESVGRGVRLLQNHSLLWPLPELIDEEVVIRQYMSSVVFSFAIEGQRVIHLYTYT